MFRTLSLLIALVLSISCSKSSSSGGDSVNTTSDTEPIAPADILGKTYYYAAQKTNGDKYILAIQMEANKSVKNIAILWPASGSTIYRKNSGTYVRTGDNYTFTYTYETCNPMGSEKFNISSLGKGTATIWPDGSAAKLTFYDEQIYAVSGLNINSLQSMTEDVNCNLISTNDLSQAKANLYAQIKTVSSRKPASEK
jgi:hypothetical protein